MRSTILSFLIVLTLGARAQSEFNYSDYFYYREKLFLQTPSVLLSAAGVKVITGDTSTAISLIRQAAELNMYDTMFITGEKSIRFVAKTKYWGEIRDRIESNRTRMADPLIMEINTSDIENFWKVYSSIDKPDADKIWMNEYIMKGSQGLKTFYEVRMNANINSLLGTVRKRKTYYESIRPVSNHLHTFKPRLIQAAAQLKQIYPAAIFPPTTFSIGRFSAFGTADGGSGQLIGAEFLCDTNNVDKSSLSDWEKTVIADTSVILGILIHELIHVQQHTSQDNSLLARAINEGAADFISNLILGYNINQKLHVYGNANEDELWSKFKKEMKAEKTDNWLYNGRNEKGRPGDLGYYMGFKICESYYNNSIDKKQAVKDILTIQNFKQFLEKSRYGK